ncbi:MAG: triose-phosphate isomerase family protein [Candidatus Chromulinivorax sp.]
MTKKYYFANWKMYQTLPSINDFVQSYKKDRIFQAQIKDKIIGIAASDEHLYLLHQKLKKTSVLIGAQDCSQFAQGAYTGQSSMLSLAQVGVSFCLLGHSEVRRYAGQSEEQITLKFKLLLAANISPILCIGETLEQKEEGITLQILFEQLESILQILAGYQGDLPIFIAYEPVYAIGTGIIPVKKDLQEVFTFLQSMVLQLLVAKNIIFLYGGSVSDQTKAQFEDIHEISGFLIGKASINFQEFKKIVD